MFCEPLESRRLMSASLNASGQLTITGTAHPDRIWLTLNNGSLVVHQVTRTTATTTTTTRSTFTASAVKSILVNAGDGNDAVSLFTFGNFSVPSTVNGGNGNDVLVGGRGADHLNGDAGDDILIALDRSNHDVINGGTNGARGDIAIVNTSDTVSAVEHVHRLGLA